MTRNDKIKELSAGLRLAALSLDNGKAKEELVKIAQGLDMLQGINNLQNNSGGGGDFNMTAPTDSSSGVDFNVKSQPAEEPGKYDINRKPTLPLWNIQVLRIYASDGEDAYNIVNNLVKTLQENGHPMASVGEIKQSTDQTTPKGMGR